ncbi:MAG: DNA-processing protein DprA [Lachnospiraceae bacterium]|nr:DNA-processing protein DprA [Lachnospiraceae bacterium]
MEERDYGYLLSGLGDFSPLLLRRLLGLYGSPSRIFAQRSLPVGPKQQEAFGAVQAEADALLKERDAWEADGIRWIWCEDEAYPRRLKELADSPLGLFVKGNLPPEERPSVGIVGARSCSLYGKNMAERFGGELGEKGISVISGMARGIDGVAQEAALKRGGASFAVLGCGPDICYPPGNRRLYELLEKQGGLISEYRPGAEPLPFHFPMRNRLIAALSDVLLVLEAREKSGSLITVDQALEQGKEVLALPGRVDDALSAGCNRLIRQGAGLLSCCGDIYDALGLAPEGEDEKDGRQRAALRPDLKAVWESIGGEPKHVEEMLEESGLTLGELSLKLLELEGMGYIRQVTPGRYLKA